MVTFALVWPTPTCILCSMHRFRFVQIILGLVLFTGPAQGVNQAARGQLRQVDFDQVVRWSGRS